MWILSFLVKLYSAILLFRKAMTRQELYFNPLGKLIAAVTEPIFGVLFKRFSKEKSDVFIPFIILVLTLIYGAIVSLINSMPLVQSMVAAFSDVLSFIMLFYILSIIIGITMNSGITSHYTLYFYRIGLVWVKLCRNIFKINSNTIALPAILLVFISYIIVNTTLLSVGMYFIVKNFSIVGNLLVSTQSGLMNILELMRYLTYIIIARALLSWVSPDPRNPIVQLIYSLSEPVLSHFRKIIPSIGFVDVSAIVAIFVIEILRNFLYQLIIRIF